MRVPSKTCVFKRCDVTVDNLPLSCPMPNRTVWDAHPKVYLPIEQTGHAVCPYCQTEYFLTSQTDKDAIECDSHT